VKLKGRGPGAARRGGGMPESDRRAHLSATSPGGQAPAPRGGRWQNRGLDTSTSEALTASRDQQVLDGAPSRRRTSSARRVPRDHRVGVRTDSATRQGRGQRRSPKRGAAPQTPGDLLGGEPSPRRFDARRARHLSRALVRPPRTPAQRTHRLAVMRRGGGQRARWPGARRRRHRLGMEPETSGSSGRALGAARRKCPPRRA